MTVDEDVIEAEIDEDGKASRKHRDERLPSLSQCRCIRLRQSKGKEPEEHDHQIRAPLAERQRKIASASVLVQIEMDQRIVEEKKNEDPDQADGQRRHQLEAEGIAHAPLVPAPEVLRAEDADARHGAEDGEVEDQQKLIDDGGARHRLGAKLTDHHVVKQADEVGHGILQDDGKGDRDGAPIEGTVADQHICSHKISSRG